MRAPASMRILHVITSVDPRSGGPVEAVKQLGATLMGRGHEVEVACCDDPSESWVAEFPLTLHALGPSKGKYSYTPKLGPWLRENARRFDAVIVDGLWQYGSFAAWRALKDGPVPYFVFPHGMLDPWFNEAYPLKKVRKMLYWPWGMFPVLRDAKAVMFTTDEERLLARKSFKPYQVNERVVSYGSPGPQGDLEAQRAAFLAAFPDVQGKTPLLYLSRIHPKKACDILIEAFAQVAKDRPDWVLVMAGPDQTGWVPLLKDIAEQNGVTDRVVWPGMLTGDLKWGAYAAADAFVLPSHQENFGIVVAEALGCGTPVLLSNKVNIWREVEASGAGIVDDDTLEGTVRTLQKWAGYSDVQKAEFRAKARQCFLDHFEIEGAADSILAVLNRPDSA